MTSIARGEVEILIHITAPSRGSDDARYRALTQAYLKFEPSQHHNMTEGLIRDEGHAADSQLQEELAQSTQLSQDLYQPPEEDPESIPISIQSSQNAYLNRIQELEDIPSPILSFSSALDNADSPRFRNFITPIQKLLGGSHELSRIVDSQESYKSPPSTIADSQPKERRPVPALSSPSGIWELFLRQIEESVQPSSLYAGRDNQGQTSTSPQLPIALQGATSSTPAIAEHEKPPTSEGPSSPSPKKRAETPHIILGIWSDNVFPLTQDPTAGLKRKQPEMTEERTVSSSAPSRLLTGSSSQSSTAETASKRPRIEVDGSNTTRSKELSSSKATELATSSPAITKSIWAEKLEIQPPPPKSSTGDLTPEKLITYALHDLARKMPLEKLFIPEEQKRQFRPMERGHWLVSCQTWDPRLRQRCWEYLGNCVGKGLAGWGVWCVRDKGFETIRVYCWGVTVAHIYLLLYLASENRIRNSGACWIGGNGQAILKMGV